MTLGTLTFRPSPTPSVAWLLPSGWVDECEAPRPAWPFSVAQTSAGNPSSEGVLADAHSNTPLTEVAALGRVLVVDDEMLVRRTLALLLTKAGFAATAVQGGVEALDLLRTPGEMFDLLITDQSMPGMTGMELIATARRLHPGLSALLLSGYDMTGSGEQLPDGVPLLRKPVERKTFLDKVRALLGFEDEGGKGV